VAWISRIETDLERSEFIISIKPDMTIDADLKLKFTRTNRSRRASIVSNVISYDDFLFLIIDQNAFSLSLS
jgi:hypothetical protein